MSPGRVADECDKGKRDLGRLRRWDLNGDRRRCVSRGACAIRYIAAELGGSQPARVRVTHLDACVSMETKLHTGYTT